MAVKGRRVYEDLEERASGMDRRSFLKTIVFAGAAVAFGLSTAGCTSAPPAKQKTYPTLYELATKEWTFTDTREINPESYEAYNKIIKAETTHKINETVAIVDVVKEVVPGGGSSGRYGYAAVGLESAQGKRDIIFTADIPYGSDKWKPWQELEGKRVKISMLVINPKVVSAAGPSSVYLFYVLPLDTSTDIINVIGPIYDSVNSAGQNTIKQI